MVDPVTRRTARRREELESALMLEALPGVGPATVRILVERFGSAPAALAAVRAGRSGASSEVVEAARSPGLRGGVARGLARTAELGIRVFMRSDPEYPGRLSRLSDPPQALFVRGRADRLDVTGVGVIGARRATPRARALARRIGRAVSATGTPVVSGLALGVDGEAHRGALGASGGTIAVLGCGPDIAYPPGHHRLFEEIVARGAAVSEFLPGTPPLRHHFPRRNRILAALVDTLVVVEAGARSGALITVEHALDLGIDVWAVPGPIDEPTCEGSNALLADGARPLVSISRFLREALGTEPHDEAVGAPPELDGEEASVLDALRGQVTADDVARRTGLDASRALALLSSLELRGHVERTAGLRFRKAG